MFEKFNQLRVIFESAQPCLAPYVSAEELTQFAKRMEGRFADSKPIVMVYGVYNAGKSTLINALLGEERAEVGDVPQTDTVTAYQIGDVLLYDSPGIDAPIEHEKISREQLDKSDAVVFVLSSDGVLEEQKTYDEIRTILSANKSMIIVINNKSAYEPNGQTYNALIKKFRTNLYLQLEKDASLQAKLDKTLDFLIDAKSALKGRLAGKEKLVEISQIKFLEKALSQLFVETNRARVAKTLAYELGSLTQKALTQAEQQTKQVELQRLQALITDFIKSQSTVFEKVMAHAEKMKRGLKTELQGFAQQGQGDLMQARVNQWQESITCYLETQLQRELKRLDAEALEVNKLFIEMPLNGQASAQGAVYSADSMDNLLQTLVNKGVQLGLPEGVAKESIVTVLKQGKAWFPTLFKGMGAKTMEKIAGRITPFIGPVISTITAIYDYNKAKQQEEHMVEQQRQQLERASNQANLLVEELYDTLRDEVEDVLDASFKPLLTNLNKSLVEMSTQTDGVEGAITSLHQLQSQLQRI